MNVAPDQRDGFPRLRTYPPDHVRNRVDFKTWLMPGLGGEGGKVSGFEGVDSWRAMHAEERRYTYFPRARPWGASCDRVDYFVAGKGMWDAGWVKGCGILDCVEERGPSDHVPIWGDFWCNQKYQRWNTRKKTAISFHFISFHSKKDNTLTHSYRLCLLPFNLPNPQQPPHQDPENSLRSPAPTTATPSTTPPRSSKPERKTLL